MVHSWDAPDRASMAGHHLGCRIRQDPCKVEVIDGRKMRSLAEWTHIGHLVSCDIFSGMHPEEKYQLVTD